jgi:hypothetical protein
MRKMEMKRTSVSLFLTSINNRSTETVLRLMVES